MSEFYKYEFHPEKNILFKYYFGIIGLDDIISSWEYAISNNIVYKGMEGLVLDYRNANFDINISEYTGISNFYKANLNVFGGLRIAIVTMEAKDIVIPIMLKTQDEGYTLNPFSTVEAAVDWILS